MADFMLMCACCNVIQSSCNKYKFVFEEIHQDDVKLGFMGLFLYGYFVQFDRHGDFDLRKLNWERHWVELFLRSFIWIWIRLIWN